MDSSALPSYVQTALPYTCPACGRSLDASHVMRITPKLEELTKGDTPYHTTTTELHCICSVVLVTRTIDWQRTVYP